ncbi:hypothetical protein ANDROMEDA_3 [Bacillus phage Andromeda]|uniref:Uncharacterized protein n=4 Tax=Andromedavirus TaxID=1623275 RepID=M1HNH6_9CAUD|nr:hypothetical protein I905_gp03 [Bacillus phage Andromeda]YP_007517547.1 hypothetical protein I906_gp03 [Bacillus phage Curly]YP_008770639.1 hypothetical protein Glittering_3 [Bacillus phage Glittering]AGE60842.1 hypothetical protein GEMINI_3 [Bacillus phage Gemini]AGE60690.1 hypothetical protein CURLY_3 [Bacillus phage Curly]AGE61073.1 hypothetical protein ANDROMEDA_3 [Bacillus phage Andromeda]AGY47190.1 hypothetical protein Glittering_3 [Bacillus phage Glittering]
MSHLLYATQEDLQKYQSGYPAHMIDKTLKDNLVQIHLMSSPDRELTSHVPVIVNLDLNYIIYDDEGLKGLHLVRQK